MMTNLTIAYITARKDPKIEWFLDSLKNQKEERADNCPIIIVDFYQGESRDFNGPKIRHVKPKPTIWQGEHRITKDHWWAKSNALNTAICLCQTDWIAFCDDRCVLDSDWLNRVRLSTIEKVATCGSYEKRRNMEVVDGRITNLGVVDGLDSRPKRPMPTMTFQWYGGNGVVPLEWCLKVNGFSEDVCDSLGMEDIVFGLNLINSGFPMRYDSRMRIIEDRTPGQIDGALKRTDKGKSPKDKSHGILEKMENQKTSLNSFNIRDVRQSVLAGNPFPPPTASHNDWWDQQPIKDFA